MNKDWEYREPTQADCVPDKDGEYPMVEVWDDEKQPKRDRKLITVLPSRFHARFLAECQVVTGNTNPWRHARIRKSYAERQAEWIERNDIKVGSRVRVTRAATTGEDGWGNVECPPIKEKVGSTCTVASFGGCGGIQLQKSVYFPYFVLEPVTEPEYRKPTINDIGNVIEVSRNGEFWQSFTMVGLHDGTYYITGILENVATPFTKARIKVGE